MLKLKMSLKFKMIATVSIMTICLMALQSGLMTWKSVAAFELLSGEVIALSDEINSSQGTSIEEMSSALVESSGKLLDRKASMLAGMIAKLSAEAMADFDYDSTNSYCVEACLDPDVALCYVVDAKGGYISEYLNSDDEAVMAAVGKTE